MQLRFILLAIPLLFAFSYSVPPSGPCGPVKSLGTKAVSFSAPAGWSFEDMGTHHTVWPNIPANGFKCNIIINARSLGGQQVSKDQLASLILSQYADAPGFRLLNKSAYSKDGAAIVDISFKSTDDFDGYYRSFTYMKDGKLFLINFVGSQKQYDVLEACVDDLMESARFR